jgi:hypothetical protein
MAAASKAGPRLAEVAGRTRFRAADLRVAFFVIGEDVGCFTRN